MRQAGRPTIHTPELAAEICRRLAEGRSLRSICRADDMPDRSTVHLWVVEDREGFSYQYANARRAQALRWADEILDIADDGENDTYEDEDGNPRTDYDVIQRSRLRVDTRKWLLSKVLPKVYGEKVALTGSDGESPAEIVITRRVVVPTGNRIAQHAGPNGNGSG